jgi:hypothetical protein
MHQSGVTFSCLGRPWRNTLWLIYLIDTYTMIDTSTLIDIYTVSDTPTMIDRSTMIDSVCINQVWKRWCMYESGVSVIVNAPITSINHSVCINQVYQSCVSIRCIHLSICINQMTDTPDWCIHCDWYSWLINTLWMIYLIDTYTLIDTPD